MTKQGDVSLLNDPVAQTLLCSANPARLAYVWRDGTPRVVPIWFHWTGSEIVIGTPAKAPKLKVLRNNSPVALTIDSNVS
jgi:nitroimidazol reductase NimA-like FMN-containing flavoprotein (pyridoxamine 5'-phosphate oxidase superfamily)